MDSSSIMQFKWSIYFPCKYKIICLSGRFPDVNEIMPILVNQAHRFNKKPTADLNGLEIFGEVDSEICGGIPSK